MCIFKLKVHNVSQWPNLRHLAEPLGGAVGLLGTLGTNAINARLVTYLLFFWPT